VQKYQSQAYDKMIVAWNSLIIYLEYVFTSQ